VACLIVQAIVVFRSKVTNAWLDQAYRLMVNALALTVVSIILQVAEIIFFESQLGDAQMYAFIAAQALYAGVYRLMSSRVLKAAKPVFPLVICLAWMFLGFASILLGFKALYGGYLWGVGAFAVMIGLSIHLVYQSGKKCQYCQN
jgi:hypothetical protein